MHVCIKCGEDFADEPRTCRRCGGPVVPVRADGDILTGRLLADKYLLLERLGEGGMGSVYRAKQTQLDRVVAVKMLRLLGGPNRREMLRRFYAEAKNTSRLEHPNNVKIHDFGHTDDGLVFIVMELVKGRPLSALQRPMRASRALRIIRQICNAMGEAHRLGLVHRDLKPDNIMISDVDGEDFVRVLDYGIAKAIDSSTVITQDGKIVGTPYYMSPEQISGQSLDARSDVYAIGVILFELVVGHPPFQSDNPLVIIYNHKHEEPPRPSSLVPVSAPIEALILECLAKDPDHRPQSTTTLRRRLDALITGETELGGEVVGWSGSHPQAKTTPLEPLRGYDSAELSLDNGGAGRWKQLAIAAASLLLLGGAALAFVLTSAGGHSDSAAAPRNAVTTTLGDGSGEEAVTASRVGGDVDSASQGASDGVGLADRSTFVSAGAGAAHVATQARVMASTMAALPAEASGEEVGDASRQESVADRSRGTQRRADRSDSERHDDRERRRDSGDEEGGPTGDAEPRSSSRSDRSEPGGSDESDSPDDSRATLSQRLGPSSDQESASTVEPFPESTEPSEADDEGVDRRRQLEERLRQSSFGVDTGGGD